MSSSRAIEAALRHDRWIIMASLAGVAALAWTHMTREARALDESGICTCLGMAMSGPEIQKWSVSTIPPLILMWAEMMIAMMIPSAAPTILVFARVNRQRRECDRPYVHSGWFLLGYLSVWLAFSVAAAAAQWALHGAALLSPAMQSTSPILGGAVLIAAGIFQWTPWKRACLQHCRSPLQFLLGSWREGGVGAFRMGLEQGVYCTGCCWLLMAVLFVVGVMNILWIALLTGLVLLEKALPARIRTRLVVGAALCIWGVVMAGSSHGSR